MGKVSESELRRLYLDEKRPDREIGELLGLSTGQVNGLRRRYRIRSLQKWERRDVPPLTGELRSLLLGSLLGDGCVQRGSSRHTAQFSESHAEYDKGYIEWKHAMWGGYATSMTHRKTPGAASDQWGFHTISHGTLLPWRQRWYLPEHRVGRAIYKSIPAGVEDMMDDLALSVWYQDDGTAGHWPAICVGPRNFKRAGEVLASMGIRADPAWSKGGFSGVSGMWLIRGYREADAFLERVKPWVHPCMGRKLRPGYLSGSRYQLGYWTVTKAEVLEVVRHEGTGEGAARALGIPVERVLRHCPNPRAVQLEHVESRLRSGSSLMEVASSIKQSREWVRALCRSRGWALAQGRVVFQETLEGWIAEGVPLTEMDRRLGFQHNGGGSRRLLNFYGLKYEVRPGMGPDPRPGRRKDIGWSAEQLQALLDEGLNLNQISKRTGEGRETLLSHLGYLGLTAPERRPKTVELERAVVEAALAEAGSVPKAARLLGVSATPVYRRVWIWDLPYPAAKSLIQPSWGPRGTGKLPQAS